MKNGLTIWMLRWVLLLVLLSACSKDEVEEDNPPDNEVTEASWMKYSPIRWTHNGSPYESDYCIIYSDGADAAMKQKVGVFADEKFSEILDLFNVQDNSILHFPPGYDKIDVYINMYHDENIAAAYWGSVFITIRSASADLNLYNYLFKHELTHEFEFLIENAVNLGTDIWFSEGIAIYGGGGLNGIQDLEDLENWIANHADEQGGGNPVKIHVWDDFPPNADVTAYYYNVFDLTMRYILDEHGLGKSPQDILELFTDIQNGVSFASSFETHFGISLVDFEFRYYDLMRDYMSQLD